MKPRTRLLLLSCLLIVLPLASKPSYSQSLTAITESDIQAMLAVMDKAARKGDVDGFMVFFTTDSKIKLILVDPRTNKEVVSTLTKDEYVSNGRINMRRKISYRYERKNTRIKIYDAETATVTSELYETLKVRQGTLRISSSAVLYVGLRKGKLVITGSETRGRLY